MVIYESASVYVKKKVVSKRKTNKNKPKTGAIAGLVTKKPSGSTTKGEFVKTTIESNGILCILILR
jgi:hypothetical protein